MSNRKKIEQKLLPSSNNTQMASITAKDISESEKVVISDIQGDNFSSEALRTSLELLITALKVLSCDTIYSH